MPREWDSGGMDVLRKPTPTAWEILTNSRRSAAVQGTRGMISSLAPLAGRPVRWMGRLTLLGLVDELDAVLEELARHIEDFLHLVGHCGWCVG